MKYIKREELQKNLNTQFGMCPEVQNMLANANAQFVLDLAKQMKISYSIPSLALNISIIFFHKRCYLNFDRFVIMSASMLLACKLKDMDSRLKLLCHSFHTVITKISGSHQPYSQEKMKRIKDQICIAESQILRTLQYETELQSPHEYVKKYCDMFFAQPKQLNKKIFLTTRVLIMDSYRTRVCLLYSPLVIFLSCFLIAARYEGLRPYQNQIVEQECKKQQITPQNLFETWLQMIGSREKQTIKTSMVKECVQIINDLLKIIWTTQH